MCSGSSFGGVLVSGPASEFWSCPQLFLLLAPTHSCPRLSSSTSNDGGFSRGWLLWEVRPHSLSSSSWAAHPCPCLSSSTAYAPSLPLVRLVLVRYLPLSCARLCLTPIYSGARPHSPLSPARVHPCLSGVSIPPCSLWEANSVSINLKI